VSNQIHAVLAELQKKQLTGKLLVSQGKQARQQWQFFFFLGRLTYGIREIHRVRRWQRAINCYCPHFAILPSPSIDEATWEMDVLTEAVASGQMTLTQAKGIAESTAQEVLFSVVGMPDLHFEWKHFAFKSQPVALLPIDQILQESTRLYSQWKDAGLGNLQSLLWRFSPDVAPIIRRSQDLQKRVSANQFKTLSNLIDGKRTIWDITLQTKQSLESITRFFFEWAKLGIIEFQEVDDLPSLFQEKKRVEIPTPVPARNTPAQPAQKAPEIKVQVGSQRPLIACIDDSPAIGELLQQIFEPLGYDLLSICEPLRAAAILLQRKPDLIFLDWVMPDINGYEFCSMLRKVPSFRPLPIVVLTANANMIDRIRAKTCGATDVLSKPIDQQKIINCVKRYVVPQVRSGEAYSLA
jgi:two-component system, chemotaxis family, response regulator PixG